ncbi:hypothetical protein CDAR_263091 [Caerostris darwini]|uniref:Uncharacterized protein n=1 Tax=Caerostris darwini TaxID=1538125 RepID=A0AAV4S0N1_9ARAC|nr:hypothetical protein CDAR_263091 [Caerostris darwini]
MGKSKKFLPLSALKFIQPCINVMQHLRPFGNLCASFRFRFSSPLLLCYILTSCSGLQLASFALCVRKRCSLSKEVQRAGPRKGWGGGLSNERKDG